MYVCGTASAKNKNRQANKLQKKLGLIIGSVYQGASVLFPGRCCSNRESSSCFRSWTWWITPRTEHDRAEYNRTNILDLVCYWRSRTFYSVLSTYAGARVTFLTRVLVCDERCYSVRMHWTLGTAKRMLSCATCAGRRKLDVFQNRFSMYNVMCGYVHMPIIHEGEIVSHATEETSEAPVAIHAHVARCVVVVVVAYPVSRTTLSAQCTYTLQI